MLTLAFRRDAGPSQLGPKVNVWRDDRGVICAWGYRHDGRCFIDWPGIALFAFTPGTPEVQAWPDDGVEDARVQDLFARRLQPIILQTFGWQALHASAVAGPHGLVVFCGRSHSGKSTLAFALDRAGLRQVADDALLVRVTPTTIEGRGLPFVARLRPDARAQFSAPAETARPGLAGSLAIHAIVLLERVSAHDVPCSARRLPKLEAFSALLPHAHCYHPDHPVESRAFVHDYVAIADRVPVVALTYRGRFAELDALTERVAALAASPSAALPEDAPVAAAHS